MAIAKVNSNSVNSGESAPGSQALTFGFTCTSGNGLVLVGARESDSNVTYAWDSPSGLTSFYTTDKNSTGCGLNVSYIASCAGTESSATFNPTGNARLGVIALEFSGHNTTTFLDANYSDVEGTNWTSISATPAGAPGIAVCVCLCWQGYESDSGLSFTNSFTIDSAASQVTSGSTLHMTTATKAYSTVASISTTVSTTDPGMPSSGISQFLFFVREAASARRRSAW